jgi:hypothetical protein
MSNNGYLTLYDVQFLCSPRKVIYKKPNSKGGFEVMTEGPEEEETGGITSPNFVAKNFYRNQTAAFPCLFPNSRMTPEWLVSADVAIVVSYHPAWFPLIKRYHRNHFSMARDDRGEYQWIEEPLSN